MTGAQQGAARTGGVLARLWIATAVLLALALAGCGPDCNRYCAKLADCAAQALPPVTFDAAQCRRACDDVGGEKTSVVDCVIDRTCTDLANGHCSPTGQAGAAP